MSHSPYTAFQKHLRCFCTNASRPKLTLLSGLRASIALGLNLPIALALSISLQILYKPYPYFWCPIILDQIPQSSHRTQLSRANLPKSKPEYTCSELLQLLSQEEEEEEEPSKGFLRHAIDRGHIVGFWTMAANAKTHTVSREDVERFQTGDWEGPVVERRKGRGDCLPVWRGGPIFVAGHSWGVNKLLGVRVYQAKKQQ